MILNAKSHLFLSVHLSGTKRIKNQMISVQNHVTSNFIYFWSCCVKMSIAAGKVKMKTALD